MANPQIIFLAVLGVVDLFSPALPFYLVTTLLGHDVMQVLLLYQGNSFCNIFFILAVSGLVGWLRSPCLLSLTPLGEAVASNSPHFTTVVTLTSWLPVSSTGHQQSGNSVKRIRIHFMCLHSGHNTAYHSPYARYLAHPYILNSTVLGDGANISLQ